MEAAAETLRRFSVLAGDNATENDRPRWCGFGFGGEGVVTSARGTLRHCVKTDGENVLVWNIVSPTDEILGEGGTLQDALLGMPVPAADAEILHYNEACITVFDPCVPWELEVAYRA